MRPLAGSLLCALLLLPAATRAFDLDDVAARAVALAEKPYGERPKKMPDRMLVGSLTYDQWRDIRFRPDHALWKEKNLRAQAV